MAQSTYERMSSGGEGGGGHGAGAREKRGREAERKEREAGVWREREAGDHVDKTLKKNVINNNF